MTASRSRFYVDTPATSARDPSSRHSMFASQSELDRTARPSSTNSSPSSTLPPIISGSVDRLTSLGGEDKNKKKKKKHRFSFSNLSGSTLSLKPLFGSGRRKSVDSASQTDVVEVGVTTVGVQTQNAPTVDVPVQTSFFAWDGGRAFNGAALTPRSGKGSLPPVAVCDQKTSEKVPQQSDSSSTRVTQVTSGDPQSGLQSSGSVLSVYEVPSGQPSGATAASDTSPSFLPAGEPRSSSAVESKSDEGKGAFPSGGDSTSFSDLISGSPRLSPHWENSKSSAPGKAEIPERCPSRNKTVQFDLPDCLDYHEEPAKPISEKKRNVDEEFAALLRDLDIITDSSDDINFSYRNIQQKSLPPIQIKPAFDVFRPEYLAPIPENNEPHDTIENSHYQHTEIPSSKNLLNHIDNFTEIKNPLGHIETDNLPGESIEPDSRCHSKPGDRNSIREVSADSVKTLPPLAPTKLDISVIYPTEHSAYIYEPGIKQEEEENYTKQPHEKTVAMPTLPSFFETCGSADYAGSTDAVKCQDYDVPQQQQNGDRRQSLESECDIKLKFSRSNSCNSTRSSTLSGFDALCDSSLRFDSCENLERLEDEIIRSLCTPVHELEEEMSGARRDDDDSDGATEVNVNREASNRRRAILDKLLGGVSAEEPVFSHDSYGEKRGKFAVGTPQKYTATLTKIEHVTDEESTVGLQFDPNDSYLNNNSEPRVPSYNSSLVPVPAECPAHMETLSPKRTSLFIFPDVNSQTSEVSSVEVQVPNNVPSRLEVRRSSWSVPSFESRKSPVKNAPTHLGDVTENRPETEDETRGRCEYTNCIKPSQMQNSPFTAPGPFADLGSRPLTNRGSVRAPTPLRNDSPCDSKAQNESTENCDYASCLKPSQVHNSLFTAELSELRSSNQQPKRPVSPLPITASCQEMSTANANNTNEFFNAKKEDAAVEPEIKVMSELQITLKSPSEKDPIDNRPCDVQSTSRLPTPPPPPPPPPPKNYVPQRSPSLESEALQYQQNGGVDGGSMGAMIRAQHSKLVPREAGGNKPFAPPKSPMMMELERRFESRQRSVERQGEDDSRKEEEGGGPVGVVGTGIEAEDDNVDYRLNSETGTNRVWQNVSPVNNTNKLQNGNTAMPSDQQEHWSKSPENVYHTSYQNGINGQRNMQFAPTTIITDEPPPPGAVLVDKKVTVDGDKIHTDKYYAIPVKEVLKEKTSTTKFIPAPPKYEGIGPTEEGIPTGLRHSVKKENMHNWYKTMYKSLHKADENLDDTQEYIIGYTSEPETRKDIMIRKKSATLDNRQRNETRLNNVHLTQDYPPSAKSTIDVYNVHPRLIEDYEPGQSSVTDNCITYGSKRFLPAMNVPKPSYEFKKGYESDTTLTKKSPQPESLDEEQQKAWYRQIQRGGDIPQFGLGKVVPERPNDPVIGPPPPPPMNYHPRQPTYQEATRPTTLPSEYTNQNGNSLSQQPNGIYETQIRQALHSEMQRRMSPSSQQLSPPNRSMSKSPSKSPEMRTPSRALFNFNSESPKELSLKKGEMVLILRQLDKNWYEGEKKGTVGIFPINYVEIVPPEHISFPTKSSVEGLGKALYDFKAQTPVEISVRKGDTVAIIRRVDVNWYEGRIANKKGIVPVSYIQVLQQPYESKTSSPSPKAFTDSRSRSASKERTQNTSNASPVYTIHSPNSDYVSANRNKFQNRSKKGNSLIEPVLYRAVYSYSPQNSDELELLEGDTIYVVEMCDDGWYVGTSVRTGVFGIVPGNYLEKV